MSAASAEGAAPPPADVRAPRGRGWFLGLLVAVGTCSAIDRMAVATLGPEIARDLGLTDFQLGLTSGFGFALMYAFIGLPLARLADKGDRVKLIAASVAIWSLFLLLSALVRNFWQMMICRIVVAVGEAGVQPPSVSLVSDLFPRERWGAMLGIMAISVPLGTVIGSAGAGWLAELYSWRVALILLAAPGMVLALLFLLTLREPGRGLLEGKSETPDASTPALAAVARRLGSKRSFWHLLVAIAATNIAVYGIGSFLPQYFVRVVGLSMGNMSLLYGIIGAVSTIGFVFGGMLAGRWARTDERRHAWFCALALAVGAPFYILAFQTVDPIVSTALLTVGGTCMFLYFTPTQVILQNMVEPRMRATAAFVFFFVSGLIGAGIGAPLTGLLSDLFAAGGYAGGDYATACAAGAAATPACAAAAASGIRFSLTATALLFFWAAVHFHFAARSLKRDLHADDR